jgi:predicted XRE-type DNA-binding protein
MAEDSRPIKSSGNIFADLGIQDAEKELAKAQLARAIRRMIEVSKLTQEQAAACMGTSQPKVSAIMGGKLGGFTSDRLLGYLKNLECDVEIIISRKPESHRHGEVRVVCTV